ncbi:MAG: hypothetical protein K2J04_13450, partial [Lachnospiraceae bacterium]|nr:hypothetical protein [Lachnospiraceae bacterium]
MKIKIRMTILIILIIPAMVLSACGSNGTGDRVNKPDSADASEITENTAEIAADIVESMDSEAADEVTPAAETPEETIPVSEMPDEIILNPETYEDYMKLADIYLQMDDVMQALAVLDEGIEKFGAGEQGAEGQEVDLLSQRKEYILAGTVAVGTNSTTNRFDDDGNILYESVRECDENGNELRYQSINYNEEGGIRYLAESRYDGNGNQIECKYIDYDSDGDITNVYHKAWAYDENGNEIEYISYDENGNIERMEDYEYDANGKQIEETNYDKNGRRDRWVKIEYDAAGNETLWECYYKYGRHSMKRIHIYDERGELSLYAKYEDGSIEESNVCEYNEEGKSKYTHYDGYGNITEIYEYEYDENDRMIKIVRYNGNGTVNYAQEHEYDENGNEIKFVDYNGDGSIDWMSEYEYDENSRKIYYRHESDGIVTETRENKYDEDGNIIKEIRTFYDSDTRQEKSQTIQEYTYDGNGNRIGYAINRYDEEEAYSLLWERKYDKDGRETAFYLYDNEKAASYQSESGYDENGRMINYTGYDKNGNVLVKRETEYDASGKVMRKNEYDADGNLIRYFENEYDDFGSLTRQTMYENGILKSEKQTSYAYHYIGNIDAEDAEYMDNDITPEEYNIKQREIFTRFLNGEEKVRYYIDVDNVIDGKIVEKTITDLLDFEHIR